MKTKITLIFLLLCMIASAQDIIVTTDSKRIESKIEEVGKDYIKYRKKSNPNGPLFVMSASEIKLIVYENGEAQMFEQEEVQTATQPITPEVANSFTELQAASIQCFTLNPDAPRTDERLVVENMTSEAISLKVYGLCHLSGKWEMLGETGNLIPYKEAKKHSTFSKKYFANIYKSTYDLIELQGVDGRFQKIAIVSSNGEKYRALFQHWHSDLMIKVYNIDSSEGIYEDDQTVSAMDLQNLTLPAKQDIKTEDSETQTGFTGYIEASGVVGTEVTKAITGSPTPLGITLGGANLNAVFGAKLCNWLFLGGGTGLNVTGGETTNTSGTTKVVAVNLPLYANSRFWIPISSDIFRPTADLAVGMYFPLAAQIDYTGYNVSEEHYHITRAGGFDGHIGAIFRIGIGGEVKRFIFGVGYELWAEKTDCDHFAYFKLGVRFGKL